jgi:hypothetical protein
MNNIIFILFVIYGISHSIKETILFDKIRIWLINKNKFFLNLFSCYFCVGWYSGLFTYLLTYDTLNIRQLIFYGFLGAATSFIFDLIIENLVKNLQ